MSHLESLLFNPDVIKGAAQQLPLLIVMWYMMKELKKTQDHQAEAIVALRKEVADEKLARIQSELATAKERGGCKPTKE